LNKGQLERIRGNLRVIEQIVEEDTGSAGEIIEKLGALQGTVAQELKNTVWKEYLNVTGTKEALG